MTRTLEQNKAFHALLTQRKFDREDKDALVLLITGGRTNSSSQMTVDEMRVAIERLQDANTSSLKKMRAKIYLIARDIFGIAEGAKFEQKDYDAVDAFMVRNFKAKLYLVPYEMLPKAVTAMEAWREWARKKAIETVLSGDS